MCAAHQVAQFAMNTPISVLTGIFAREGHKLCRSACGLNSGTGNRRFRALIGATPLVCAQIWTLVGTSLPPSAKPVHMLYVFLFLKVYASENVNRLITGVDEKTFRNWSWCFVDIRANLKVIKWTDRNIGRENMVYRSSVVGVDFKIKEPSPFDPKWFSHKFKSVGLRYEVAFAIGTGNICWANGPFPYGSHSDLKIYKSDLKQRLDYREEVIADGGYRDATCSFSTTEYMDGSCGYIRARHEAVNKRLRQFHVLERRFRHPLGKHSTFFSCCN